MFRGVPCRLKLASFIVVFGLENTVSDNFNQLIGMHVEEGFLSPEGEITQKGQDFLASMNEATTVVDEENANAPTERKLQFKVVPPMRATNEKDVTDYEKYMFAQVEPHFNNILIGKAQIDDVYMGCIGTYTLDEENDELNFEPVFLIVNPEFLNKLKFLQDGKSI